MSVHSRRILRIHGGLVLAESICVSAFVFEISRALSGNTLSWAYVVEWPVLGGYGVYMWRQLLRQERGDGPEPSHRAAPSDRDAAELDRYNEYLRQVHERDVE